MPNAHLIGVFLGTCAQSLMPKFYYFEIPRKGPKEVRKTEHSETP
jgi:hypothetical protein